jgi:hypothetical protein
MKISYKIVGLVFSERFCIVGDIFVQQLKFAIQFSK